MLLMILLELDRTPGYNWNIVESGVKHHKHSSP